MRIEPQRGDVWRVDMEPTRADEIRKTWPAVVISANDVGWLKLKMIVPLTDWKPHYEQDEYL